MFSNRSSPFFGSVNRLYALRDALVARGKNITDLISGQVAAVAYPEDALEAVLREGRVCARVYRPDPLGQPVAREAVAQYYRQTGFSIPAGQIVLTPGTSLSYLYAFLLFADAGDEVLAPIPTYSLFDAIASLCGVKMVPYRLDASRGWAIDIDHLQAAVTGRTRAIVIISPHNPTGAVASGAELAAIATLARQHQIPILSDEVFGEFLFDRNRLPRPAATDAPLVVTLNGFSKMFALPGMKIGWMALSGASDTVSQATEGLAAIADTFLPVNEVAQFAVPGIFREGEAFLQRYRKTISQRRAVACDLLSSSPRLSFVPPAGGFYLTLRIHSPDLDEERLALDLLRAEQILVHPGFFYDLDRSHLVISYTSDEESLRRSLKRLVQQIESRSA
jgi:aspartate/methionine/tyrosine aminotransferase